MGNLEPFEKHKTNWLGLWYHKENYLYMSTALNLADLRKFKGNIRLVVRKNRYYEKDTNRPNMIFCITDANSENPSRFEVIETGEMIDTQYRTSEGERLYTRDEVLDCINGAIIDARNGFGIGDVSPDDYV